MAIHHSKEFAGAFDQYLRSPYRTKPTIQQKIDAIEWAISLLQIHKGVKTNPNSQMWLDRLRAIVHHYKLDLDRAAAKEEK